jgi:aconitate hydratase
VTGRPDDLCVAFENYYKAQGLWGVPNKGDIDYTVELDVDLSTVVPAVAGPRRPQDRIELTDLKASFRSLLTKHTVDGGYGKAGDDLSARFEVHINGSGPVESSPLPSTDTVTRHVHEGDPANKLEMIANRPAPTPASDLPDSPYRRADVSLGHGSVLIAAITS